MNECFKVTSVRSILSDIDVIGFNVPGTNKEA